MGTGKLSCLATGVFMKLLANGARLDQTCTNGLEELLLYPSALATVAFAKC